MSCKKCCKDKCKSPFNIISRTVNADGSITFVADGPIPANAEVLAYQYNASGVFVSVGTAWRTISGNTITITVNDPAVFFMYIIKTKCGCLAVAFNNGTPIM